jgi:ATP phosphoribosyltransferase
MSLSFSQPTIFAIPKGRIFEELAPMFDAIGIAPEKKFFDEGDRSLRFESNIANLSFIRVRSFDVATFVAHGAAQLGVCGSDVMEEFDYPELYAPLDLGIGKCRLSVAEPKGLADSDDPTRWTHVKIATKYPNLTARHFAARGVQAECITLNGAMELAPAVGLSERIVDLVSSGATLKANGLVEIEKIMEISSRLIVNRTAYKTRNAEMAAVIDAFKGACHGA